MITPDQAAAQFNREANSTGARARKLIGSAGFFMQRKVRSNASGRPGPNAPTGNYRRSWTSRLVTASNPLVQTVVVGSNAPQGPRLEYGFVGIDKLGRVYDQAPFPHARRALAPTNFFIFKEINKLFGDN